MKKSGKKKSDTLVIVESPSKAKTIHKYLGEGYVISSSVGHIIDLPKSRMAIDVENGFKPEYITIRGKAKVLNELKRKASKASRVLLATDPDREGEAISWHLKNALSPKNTDIKRIEFNEITRDAILDAIDNPREINIDLVNAQQARRILDRIVGYNISPILWKKIKKGLSAGRVQSVALRVLCEREQEIELFRPEEYWTIEAECSSKKKNFKASLHSYNGDKLRIRNKDEVDSILEALSERKLTVKDLKIQERKRKPNAPYITSKLQQDAANRLGFNSKKSMIIAQQLYEGISLTDEGPVGLVTYIRTDSVRVSSQALESVRKYISDNFKEDYLPEKVNVYKNKKGAQDAHEAIRPSDLLRTPESLKNDLTRDQYRMYDMIWKRFVSSQMTPEVSEVTSAVLENKGYQFRATGSRILFKGFTAVEKNVKSVKTLLPELEVNSVVDIVDFFPEQRFTTPPPRYNDASLVKFLEESGVGRPSTYTPTIDTLMKRYYAVRSGRQLIPTVLGRLVNNILSEHFSNLVSVKFTSDLEDKLDLVEEARSDWVNMLEEFYEPFKQAVSEAEVNIEEMKGILDEETDEVCEKCGKMMLKRIGRYGFFLACSGFPDCRNSKSLPLGKCPECSTGSIVKKSSKNRRGNFYACNTYPDCEFSTREIPAERPCPVCDRLLFKTRVKGKGEKLTCKNSECDFEIDLLDESNKAEEAS